MGLLDDFAGFIKTPEGQGLLSGVAGWAAGARKGTPWNNIGRGGLAGLSGYGSALEQQSQLGQAEQAKKLRDMQISEMLAAKAQKEKIQGLAMNSVLSPESQAIGKFGPTPEGAAAIGQFKPTFDTEGFLSGMMGIDPMQAMTLKKSMQPAPIKMAAGETLVDPASYKPIYSAPEKVDDPISKLLKARDQIPVGDPRRVLYDQAISKATTHAPAASAVVKMPPMETEFGKAVGKQQGEEYSSIQKAGFAASGTLNNLNRVESLLDGVNTGKLAPLGKDISSLAASVGINIDPNLPQKEAVAALSNEMALKAKNSGGENMMPGAMSDPDRRFLVEMVPGLSNTPGGNKIIIETLKRKAKRDQQVAKMAREYIGKNRTLDGFSDELAAWSEKNPLFSDLATKASSGNVRAQADAIIGR